MWASSTANALKLSSSASKSHLLPAFSISRCFSSGKKKQQHHHPCTQLVCCIALVLGLFYLKSIGWCFGFEVLEGLKYANSHEWVKHEGSVATIGISDHAQVTKTRAHQRTSLDQILSENRDYNKNV